ncbi:ankyrin repeat-containing domain protein [Dactylonectria macrodidyma]|uniref:Ankyrin repeat-containing domain protein n=1 Tax=Dactylonectria macrodidyma TaxID=307937 RepID=A0A9P9I8B0_9HYPO|nr:ankyrin repeat-containing domain protein [Dactylonectria macrodidyma]
MSNPNNYTVGWICAIATEYVAARAFLEEEHEGPEQVSTNDNNDYTLGRIGKHNVVIAALPHGEYGISSAAGVARDMLHSFPNVRIGMMVGIGGGAPSPKHDIRLGDIVPRALHPPNDESSCATTCGDDPSTLIVRDERSEDEDNPSIHYGLIASANRLMKDALMRDALAMKKDVLCFEMEAAGLMNHFPCLVIRGICDYSDSHKNKEWQGYAAMAAAAYAKDLLCRIAPNRVEAEKKIGDILSGLHEFAEEHLDVAKRHHEVAEENRDLTKEQLQAQEDLAKERLSKDKQEEEQKCHQLFRLTTDGSDATYEWYKGRVEERVEGTCLWLLKHKHFQSWLEQESGPLLVTADPGCGKSVLAKYLIDHGLPRSTTICYFFFKDQDQNTVRQALCALLHQLFSQRLSLIEHALRQFRQDGQSLINSTESLWEILRNAVKDPQAGPVIMVLDALDECAESEFADLMRNVESQFRSNQLGYGKLKYLLTSRPYEQIVSRFCCLLDDLQKNRIPGEEESKTISQEVNRVITHRVNHLSEKKRLSPQIKSHLEKRLQETTHRTYLWVYLVFDYLENESFKKTLKGIESAIATLPMSINEAYEQILHKSNAKEHPMVRKVLSIILAASRPLTLSEMNVALNIDNTSQSFHDLDLEDEEDFKLRLRSWCGLFVSIYHGKIYFLHQTAREFLLADLASPTTVPSEPHWHHSITTRQAHAVIAELCVLYLNFFNSDVSLPTDVNREAGHPVDCHAFLDYSAKTWGAHFREADIIDDAALVPSALRICNPDSKSYSAWFRIYWKTTGMNTTEYFTDLMVASYFGHGAVVKLLLQQGAEVDSKDRYYGGTPLWWAARNGHEVVVKLLLDKGADVEAKGRESGQTPLWWATKNGHEVVVKLLLDKGADVEAEGKDRLGRGRTPLWWAARIGHEAVVKLLLDKGADVEAKDRESGPTPLWLAVIKLLLGKGANVVAKDSEYGQTPLWWATKNGHEVVVKLLLDKGADVEAKDRESGPTPLWLAVIKLLLGKGANVVAKDSEYGQTPLWWATKNGHEVVVKLLLDKGADVEAKDRESGPTPLWLAVKNGHEAVVKLLLDKGANVEAKDSEYGRTPLLWATKNGREVVVKLLLDKGADVEAEGKDRLGRGRTPLWWAARIGHEAVVKLLLDKGADVEAEGKDRLGRGRTPLWWATRIEHEAVVKLLLDKGADVDVEAKDRFGGGTPLSRAAKNGHHTAAAAAASKGGVEVIQVLLSRGEEVKITADVVRAAAGNEDSGEEVMALLLEKRGDEVKITADVVNAAVGNWQSGKGVITLLLEKDLQSHPSNLPSRNVCLLDDRTNDGKRSDPQRRPGPLNVRQLYLELKKERFPLGNLHCVQDQDTTAVDTDSAQPTSLNADKRLIFLTDLNPWGAMALVSTASKNEAAKLQRMIYRHLTFESYIGVRSVAVSALS